MNLIRFLLYASSFVQLQLLSSWSFFMVDFPENIKQSSVKRCIKFEGQKSKDGQAENCETKEEVNRNGSKNKDC